MKAKRVGKTGILVTESKDKVSEDFVDQRELAKQGKITKSSVAGTNVGDYADFYNKSNGDKEYGKCVAKDANTITFSVGNKKHQFKINKLFQIKVNKVKFHQINQKFLMKIKNNKMKLLIKIMLKNNKMNNKHKKFNKIMKKINK
jgi:hypothetical protein